MRIFSFHRYVGYLLAGAFCIFEHPLQAAVTADVLKSSGPQIFVQGGFAFDVWMGSEHNKKKKKYKKDTASNTVNGSEVTHDAVTNFAIDAAKLEFQVKDNLIDAGALESWLMSLSLSGDRNTTLHYIVPRVYLGLIFKQGSMTLGNYPGVEDSMAHGGAELMAATGGFASTSHSKFVHLTTGCYSRVTLVGDSADTTKIIIQSPRLWGVQVGVNYAPDSRFIGKKNRTSDKDISPVDLMYNKHVTGVGVDYVDFIAANTKLSVSLTGLFGKPYASQEGQGLDFFPTQGVGCGVLFDFEKCSFGVEGAWMGQTGMTKGDVANITPPDMTPLSYKAADAQGPRFVDAAFSLFVNPETKFVLGYYTSWRQTGFADNKGVKLSARAHIVNMSVTQQLNKNVQTYVEGFFHHTANPAAAYENTHILQASKKEKMDVIGEQKAWTLVIGTRVRF